MEEEEESNSILCLILDTPIYLWTQSNGLSVNDSTWKLTDVLFIYFGANRHMLLTAAS